MKLAGLIMACLGVFFIAVGLYCDFKRAVGLPTTHCEEKCR